MSLNFKPLYFLPPLAQLIRLHVATGGPHLTLVTLSRSIATILPVANYLLLPLAQLIILHVADSGPKPHYARTDEASVHLQRSGNIHGSSSMTESCYNTIISLHGQRSGAIHGSSSTPECNLTTITQCSLVPSVITLECKQHIIGALHIP